MRDSGRIRQTTEDVIRNLRDVSGVLPTLPQQEKWHIVYQLYANVLTFDWFFVDVLWMGVGCFTEHKPVFLFLLFLTFIAVPVAKFTIKSIKAEKYVLMFIIFSQLFAVADMLFWNLLIKA
jgi:hypothetical protein